MKTATVSEARDDFRKLLDLVRNGESVEITDDGHPVARLVPTTEPPSATELEQAHLDRLERAGILRRGTGKMPVIPPPEDSSRSSGVLEALLEERREGR